MPKGLQRSLARGPRTSARIVKQTIPLRDFIVNVAAAGAGVGFGSSQVYEFPEGNIMLLGAVLDAVITEASANLADTLSGDIGVGTTAADDGTITGADVNVIGSTAMGPMVASSLTVQGTNVTDAIIDATAGALAVFINCLVDAADITDASNGDLVLNGQLVISYQVMGDN